MSVSEFKKQMVLGRKVNSQLFWKDHKTGELRQVNDLKEREVSIVQTQRFALSAPDPKNPDKTVNSWGDFPKLKDLNKLDANTWEVIWEGGKLIYQFI